MAHFSVGAVLDEIQRALALLSYLKGIIDRARKTGMLVLTGSHRPEPQPGISQSPAGRIGQVVNYTSLSNDMGGSDTTIKSWISVLKASFVVWELSP